MSTAQQVIERAYANIGVHSENYSADQSLLDEGLIYLKSMLSELANKSIILKETDDDGNVTFEIEAVANIAALTTELGEPPAATIRLSELLTRYLAPISRRPVDPVIVMAQGAAFNALRDMYLVHEIPDKVPSTLLPLGQGSQNFSGVDNAFFTGQSLAKDKQ